MVLASTILFTNLLLVTATLARPSLEHRLAQRGGDAHVSHSFQPVSGPKAFGNRADASSYWSGAVLSGNYSDVTATIVVPTLDSPSGSSGTYYAAFTVGFDGAGCNGGLIRLALQATLQGGAVSYGAWVQLDSNEALLFSDISFDEGDQVSLSVIAGSTSRVVVIENLTTGKKAGERLELSNKVCKNGVLWEVQLWGEDGSASPFANFGTVTFSGALASTPSGNFGPSTAQIFSVQNGGNESLTTVSVSDTDVTIQYIEQ